MRVDGLPRVLVVDDEEDLLAPIRRSLGRNFAVSTATSAAEALALADRDGPFAVVAADLDMPGTDGLTLCEQLRARAADTVCLLLTRQEDVERAVGALGNGTIFRFLIKPPPRDVLMPMVEAALAQHRLLQTERVLLGETLCGTVRVVTELFAMVHPAVGGRALRARSYAARIAAVARTPDSWQLEVAVMVAALTRTVLPGGPAGTSPSDALADQLPAIAAQPLRDIPHLEPVWEMLRQQGGRVHGDARPGMATEHLAWGARVLDAVLDFDTLETNGRTPAAAVADLRDRAGRYDPAVLDILADVVTGSSAGAARGIGLHELRPGMLLAEDVRTAAGAVVAARGQVVTAALLEHLRPLRREPGVHEPIAIVPSPQDETAAVPETPALRSTPAGARSVLLVDDDPVVRRMLARGLESASFELLEAESAAAALDVLAERPVDVVVSDETMPGMTGTELLARVRDAYPETIRIMLTGASRVEVAVNAINAGEVYRFFTKPCEPRELAAAVADALLHCERIREDRRRTAELIVKHRQLLRTQQQFTEDLRAAALVQRTLIPAAPPPVPSLRAAWRFLPCDQIGGDIFNVQELDDDHVGLYVLDVSGHGLPAAMVAVAVSQNLSPRTGCVLRRSREPNLPPEIVSPAEVLTHVDREYPIERFEKHFTLCYVVVNHRNGTLRYSSAGHPPPVLLRADGRLELLTKGGPVIGLSGLVPFDEGTAVLDAGDRLFLYTDGIFEFTNQSGDAFGDGRLCRELQRTKHAPLDEACEQVLEALTRFGDGVPLQDDVTLVGVELCPTGVAARSADIARGGS